VLNWITPGDLEYIEPLPRDRRAVSLVVPVCPTADRELMDRTMRPVRQHPIPGYEQQQRRLDRMRVGAMWAMYAGDKSRGQTALPLTLDEFVVWGSRGVRAHHEIERRTGPG
jgi:hypothetical protein